VPRVSESNAKERGASIPLVLLCAAVCALVTDSQLGTSTAVVGGLFAVILVLVYRFTGNRRRANVALSASVIVLTLASRSIGRPPSILLLAVSGCIGEGIAMLVARWSRRSSWWYADGDRRAGPVKMAELRRLILTDRIGLGSLVWREGMPGWKPLGEIDELRSLQAGIPPPLPNEPVSTSVPTVREHPSQNTPLAWSDPPGAWIRG
jgi:hypothetical protein